MLTSGKPLSFEEKKRLDEQQANKARQADKDGELGTDGGQSVAGEEHPIAGEENDDAS